MKEISSLNLELIRVYNKILNKELSCDEVVSLIKGMKYQGKFSFEELEQFIAFIQSKELYQISGRLLNFCGFDAIEALSREKSLEYFEKGLKLLEQVQDHLGIISNYSGMMCTYFGLGMYDESLNFGMKALRLAEESKNPYLTIQVLANIAVNYLELGYDLNAKQALEAIRKLDRPSDESHQVVLDILEARLYLADNHLDEAMTFIQKALDHSLNLEYRLLICECYRIRGIINYRLEDYEQSYIDFGNSIHIAKSSELLEQLVLTYYEWGKVEYELNRYQLAEEHLLKAHQYSQQLQAPLLYSKICKSLVELYKQLENYKKALDYYEMSSNFERQMELKRSEIWSKRLAKEKIISEAKLLKSLYDDLQRISEIGRSFTQKLDYKKIIMRVQKELSKLMDTTFLLVTQFDESNSDCCHEYVVSIVTNGLLESKVVTSKEEKSLGAYCLTHQKDLIIYDFDKEYEAYDLRRNLSLDHKGVRSLLCCPLLIQDKVTGYISVQSYEVNQYTQQDLSKLSLLASYIAIALENARLYKQTNYLARYDGLTHIYNRMEVLKKGQQLFDQNDHTKKLSVIMFDVDYFKKVNDTFGHQAGDEVIEQVGCLLNKYKNKQMIAGRYGGEEFIVFLVNQSEESVLKLVEVLSDELQNIQFSFSDTSSVPYQITASFGVYHYHLEEDTLEQGIALADEALYHSKINGRNQVTIYQVSSD